MGRCNTGVGSHKLIWNPLQIDNIVADESRFVSDGMSQCLRQALHQHCQDIAPDTLPVPSRALHYF
jgi:hypothetical protein